MRTELTVPMPLPAQDGGDLEALWEHVRIPKQDQGVVVGWMLAASQPERSRAAGILYLSGPSGAGKSCAADIIARAGGAPADRKQFGAHKMDGRDFLVGASAGWVTYLDNLSVVTAEQSDTLCCLVTGLTETYRTMRTNVDTTSIDISRPVIATSVEIPVLRADLITRMAPVQLDLPYHPRPEDDVMADAKAAQPRIFAGYLNLLSKVMASEHLPIPAEVPLPRLAVMGRMAHAADRYRGTGDTLKRLERTQGELLNETLTDYPFFATIIHEIKTEFVGGGEALLADIDPDQSLAAKYGKQWPIGSKGVSHRLKRHVGAFARVGWTVKSVAATHHQPTQWIITPPEGPESPAH
ncbi:MAG: hypothetical protein M0Z95_27755 [Actinomycetota bacterium]|nr:hypothetical protein [Actinomycetota bacterium]